MSYAFYNMGFDWPTQVKRLSLMKTSGHIQTVICHVTYWLKTQNQQIKQTYQQAKTQTHRYRQQDDGYQRGRGWRVKGVEYMVTEGD